MRKLSVRHRNKISVSLQKNGELISKKQSESWTIERKKQYSENHGKSIINDLTGRKFGTLNVIEPVKLYDNRWFWRCKCDCGNFRNVRTTYLTTGRVVTCELEAKQNANAKYRRKPQGESTWNSYYSGYRKEAANRDIDFDLSLDQFKDIASKDCYHCGNKPKLINYQKKTSLDPKWGDIYASGIDRLDSDVGYSITNCVSSCWRCNSAKNDQTLEEFHLWLKRTYEYTISKGRIQ